jgi:hypothetical protein
MARAFGVCIFLLAYIASTAQRNCGTADYLLRQPQNIASPTFTPTGVARDTIANEIITIPVVVHLLYKTAEQNITDAQIKSQIEALNKDYRKLNADAGNTPAVFKPLSADAKIQFCLAQVDPMGKRTKGIIRKYTSKDYFTGDDAMKYTASGGDNAWPSKLYLNIWVCNLIGRTLGYATVPGASADKDGVVINWDVFGTIGNLRYPFNKGRTATHEIGHWLGLKHLWGDALCGDDDVFDTPKQQNYNFNCPVFPHVTSCSPDANGDMFMNFMDFTDDNCMTMFTQGQVKKMRGTFAIGAAHNSFLNATGCDSSLATGGPIADPIPISATIKIYPNPVSDVFWIESNEQGKLEKTTVSLWSVKGEKVKEFLLLNEKNKISMAGLIPGIYFLRLSSGEKKMIIKIPGL